MMESVESSASVTSNLRDQFRHALQQQDSSVNPFFTCPLCEKCPVCSVSSQRRRVRQQQSSKSKSNSSSDLSLSMPSNWTNSFTSPSRKGNQTSGGRPQTLVRADSTQSLTPQQNLKNVRLSDTLEEKTQTIENMRVVIDEHKADLNLMVNKLQYADIELKQCKGKVYQKDKELSALRVRVRALESSLDQSRAQCAEVARSLATSEACRSNTARELGRCRRELQAGALLARRRRGGRGGNDDDVDDDSDGHDVRQQPSSRDTRARGGRAHSSSSSSSSVEGADEHEYVHVDIDISTNKEVLVKAELASLMGQIAGWNVSGILPDMTGQSDWLEHVHSQLDAISSKI
jgi:hypothetical protein